MNISDIITYYINPHSYSYRRKGIEDTLHSVGFKKINRIEYNNTFPDRAHTMSKAHIYTLQVAIDNNKFPFIVFEDDARLIKPLPETINIPEETRLIYLGGSSYYVGKPVRIENYNNEYFRVYNMLSFHAVLIPNKESAEFVINTFEEAISKGIFNDENIAIKSENNIFLVPKDGNYFYQDDYTADVTKFLWKDFK